jgi:hypothetical protein
VKFPTVEEMAELAALTGAREPLMSKVWGFVDGLNLRIQEPEDDLRQNAYYNGWLGHCYCSNLLVWRSDGLLGYAALNFPGSWHDGALASQGFYKVCKDLGPTGFQLAGDSAFRTKLIALLVVAKESTKMPPAGPERIRYVTDDALPL